MRRVQEVVVYFHNGTNLSLHNVSHFRSRLIKSKLYVEIKYKNEELNKVKVVKFYDVLGYSFLDTEYDNNFVKKEKSFSFF